AMGSPDADHRALRHLIREADARLEAGVRRVPARARAGLAYQMPHRVVMRASYGMSYLPLGGNFGLVTVRQNGYSRSTPYNATVGGGINSYIPNMPGASTWENPYPNGVLQPYGNTLGVKTAVGTGVTFDSPDYRAP